jgi:hypothetical protein
MGKVFEFVGKVGEGIIMVDGEALIRSGRF